MWGDTREGDRRKALLYSLTFILGLSITFTILGAIASFIGGLFGVVGRTWYLIVGGVAVAIGLHSYWPLPLELTCLRSFSTQTARYTVGLPPRSHLRYRVLSMCYPNPRPLSSLLSPQKEKSFMEPPYCLSMQSLIVH